MRCIIIGKTAVNFAYCAASRKFFPEPVICLIHSVNVLCCRYCTVLNAAARIIGGFLSLCYRGNRLRCGNGLKKSPICAPSGFYPCLSSISDTKKTHL
jgi:hypothetical protein